MYLNNQQDNKLNPTPIHTRFQIIWMVSWFFLISIIWGSIFSSLKTGAFLGLLMMLPIWLLVLISNFSLNYYNPINKNWVYYLTWIGVLSLLSGLVGFVSISFTSHFDVLFFNHFHLLISFIFFVPLMIISPMYLLKLWSSKLQRLEEELLRKTTSEMYSKQAELFYLRQQLQPHFLFNSLNSILALLQIDPNKAKEMIGNLSTFLRSSIKSDDEKLSTLEHEIGHLNMYMEIEKVRFGDRLDFDTVNIQDFPVNAYKVPHLILQPLIENAIKYGVYGTLDRVHISFSIEVKNQALHLIIENSYEPEERKLSHQGTGFGLNAVRRRLFLLYGRNDLLTITPSTNTFKVRLEIPQT